MSCHPSLKTFEEFLKYAKQDTEESQQYLYKRIKFAEKEYERLRTKGRRQYWRRKEAIATKVYSEEQKDEEKAENK